MYVVFPLLQWGQSSGALYYGSLALHYLLVARGYYIYEIKSRINIYLTQTSGKRIVNVNYNIQICNAHNMQLWPGMVNLPLTNIQTHFCPLQTRLKQTEL